jgi:predicted nucleic acid-binding protein
MKAGYFIDTSVWIEYLRDPDSKYGDLIDTLIDEDRIFVNGIVLAELLVGAGNRVEADRLASAMSGLKFLPGGRDAFLAAGRKGQTLRKKGITVPLSDVIIASDCIDQGLVLIESDKHYAAIAAILPLKRYVAP